MPVGFLRVAAAAAACACVVVVGVLLLHRYRLEGRLLQADPVAIPGNARLISFATGRGEALFANHCATCHGAAGAGDTARGIPDLTDADWLYGTGSIGDIEQVVDYGIRSYHPKAWNLAIMPAYGTAHPSARDGKIPPLSPGNIRDLVAYLWYRQGRVTSHGSDTDATAVARGAALFAGAGGCYDCHASDAKGDTAIGAPNLTDRITLYGDGSREALTQSISYGRAGVCPAWVGKLSPAAIREVAVYVYALSRRAPG
jgi:cytochrome c oxidase cbb3-type subunit 3